MIHTYFEATLRNPLPPIHMKQHELVIYTLMHRRNKCDCLCKNQPSTTSSKTMKHPLHMP